MSLLTPAMVADLTARYSEPHRHYHTPTHVRAMLSLLAAHRSRFADPEAVEAAVWFHDAVYDVRAHGGQNERESAEMAVRCLEGEGTTEGVVGNETRGQGEGSTEERRKRIESVREMILATASHEVPPGLLTTAAEDGEAAPSAAGDLVMFLDLDLSILAAPNIEEFDQYETAVRREYSWVTDEGWRTGRAEVLETFLNREYIFKSKLFREKYEQKARDNIRWSLARLRGPSSDEAGGGCENRESVAAE